MDERSNPAIPQIVFYQSGIGSDKNLYSQYIEGIDKFLGIAIHFWMTQLLLHQELPEVL